MPGQCRAGLDPLRFWFPGNENDGAAGWQFMSAKFGHAWMGAYVPRGLWPVRG
jgi:hypothetical protein